MELTITAQGGLSSCCDWGTHLNKCIVPSVICYTLFTCTSWFRFIADVFKCISPCWYNRKLSLALKLDEMNVNYLRNTVSVFLFQKSLNYDVLQDERKLEKVVVPYKAGDRFSPASHRTSKFKIISALQNHWARNFITALSLFRVKFLL